MKKYELTKLNDKGLYQIKALIDFSKVKKGQLGGYIKSEEALKFGIVDALPNAPRNLKLRNGNGWRST